jgi:hypothetical protein
MADLPAKERLANKLWTLVGRPAKADYQGWASQFSRLLESHPLEEIADVMTFALEQNPYSAEYLRAANDPAASFAKNYDDLLRRRKAKQKADQIAIRNEEDDLIPLPYRCPHNIHLCPFQCLKCLRLARLIGRSAKEIKLIWQSLHVAEIEADLKELEQNRAYQKNYFEQRTKKSPFPKKTEKTK